MHSVVLNRFAHPSSLYKYAMDLVDGNYGNSELFNIVTNSSIWTKSHAGTDLRVKLSDNFFVSGIFSRWTFDSVKKNLNIIRRSYDDLTLHLVSPFADPHFISDIPVTVTVHDSPYALFVKGLYRRENESLAQYKRRMWISHKLYDRTMNLPLICVNSEHVGKSLKDYGYEGETFVLYPAVSRFFRKLDDKIALRKKLKLPENKKLVLSVSIDEVRKNLNMVRKVMSVTKEWASFVRIGSDIGAEYNFKDLDDETLNMIYNACDVLLIPSLEEGFGYPIVEAFKVGLPVVASDIEVFREVAGDAAIFSDPLNALELTDGIKSALSERDEIVTKGFRRVSRFEMPVFSERLKQMYGRMAEII